MANLALLTFAGFWDDYGDSIESLALFAIGITGYAVVVALFYKLLSRRRMLAPKGSTNVRDSPVRAVFYILLFPLLSFGFFLVIAAALLLLGDSDRDARAVLTISMAMVMAVRIAAYLNQDVSGDMAKMLPLGLLAVFLVDAEFLKINEALEQLKQFQEHAALVAVFFGLVVAVEFLLQIVYQTSRRRKRS